MESFGLKRYVEIIPNAMTIGALCFGLSAVRCAFSGDFLSSVQCLACSAILDGLDGHAARALKASTKIGAELDSLCDLADFGVAPCFIMYLWASKLEFEGKITDNYLWAACIFYCSCCSLRLGRFNIMSKSKVTKALTPKRKKNKGYQLPIVENIWKLNLYFEGIPAPMGAALVLTPIAWSVGEFPVLFINWRRIHVFALIVGTGLMMVSSIPTLSSKMLMRSKDSSHLRSISYFRSVLKIIGAVGAIWCILNAPMTSFCVVNLVYGISIPFSFVIYNHVKRKLTSK